MDAKCSQDWLELPTKLPIFEKGWYSENITDPSLTLLVKKMEKDLKSEKLTGAMFIKEFLMRCLALLQDRSCPLWKLGSADDKICLHQDALPEEELSKVLLYLTGKDPSNPLVDWLPLYYRDNGEEVAASMPVFDEFGLVRAGPSPPPTFLVDLSSRDQSSEATEDEVVDESSTPEQRSSCVTFRTMMMMTSPPWWRCRALQG